MTLINGPVTFSKPLVFQVKRPSPHWQSPWPVKPGLGRLKFMAGPGHEFESMPVRTSLRLAEPGPAAALTPSGTSGPSLGQWPLGP